MGLSRRFLNLIVDNRFPGAVSLLSIDLRRHKLFNTTTPADLPLINRSVSESERPPCVANANNHQKKRKKKTVKMRMLHLPAPTIDLEASSRGYSWNIKCSPLTDRKLLCTDNYGRHVLFNSEARQVEDLPFLNEPKNSTFSIFIPGAATDTNGCDDNGGGGSSIYIMERCPSHEQEQRLLSVKHTWIRVGDWTLPFTGKVEHVPELKLWFGICTNDWKLGAIDLSTIISTATMEDFQPQLVGTWKELEAPQHWSEMRCPQLANLGSGRFCIARFFHTWTTPMEPNSFGYDSIKVHSFSDFDSDSDSIEFEEHSFTVLTGTDVVPCVHDGNGTGNGNYANGSNGKVELRMIKHNSKSHISYGIDGTIRLVF
uniref:Uncharacterized protein n=1 Tax=Oryza sativa subsp. japonica TaxID=39947 RepID=Q8LIE7_ORYSJ|nr:hypothetical protein [Oryza sativa Japonica Group]